MPDHSPLPHDNASDSVSQTSSSEKVEKNRNNDDNGIELVTSLGNVITKEGAVFSNEDSSTSLSTNIFKDPEVREYYVDLYEKAQYECRHVFDAEATWSAEEEKKIIRKLDWHGKLLNSSKHSIR